jgi:hypothetical protein
MVRRCILTACFVCSTLTAGVAASNGPVTLDFDPFGAAHVANAPLQLAPADISFGQYPMSVTGIENAIHRYDGTTHLDDGPIAYAIVAIRDWETRFPRDPWIPRDLLYMQRVYEHARTEEGRAYAEHVAAWLEADYPQTEFARQSRMEFAKFRAASESSLDDTHPSS